MPEKTPSSTASPCKSQRSQQAVPFTMFTPSCPVHDFHAQLPPFTIFTPSCPVHDFHAQPSQFTIFTLSSSPHSSSRISRISRSGLPFTICTVFTLRLGNMSNLLVQSLQHRLEGYHPHLPHIAFKLAQKSRSRESRFLRPFSRQIGSFSRIFTLGFLTPGWHRQQDRPANPLFYLI